MYSNDLQISFNAITPVQRRCYQYAHRGSIYNRVQFVVRYDRPEGAADIDLGQGVQPSNIARWVAAMSNVRLPAYFGSGTIGSAELASTLSATPSAIVNEPACMRRYLRALSGEQQQQFKRLMQ